MLDAAALAEILDPERKTSISVFEHLEAYQVAACICNAWYKPHVAREAK